MRILLTGATGFLGRAVVARLRGANHACVAWVRLPERARALFGAGVELVRADANAAALAAAVSNADAVVNLSGEPLIGKRWTDARRRVLRAAACR